MNIAFYTLGCKVNQYDTQAMITILQQAGHNITDFNRKADAYIINSCTVTAESDRKTRQVIGRARQHNPTAIVLVCGCYAQRDAERILAMEGVNAVMGSGKRGDVERVLLAAAESANNTADGNAKINAVAAYGEGCEYEETPPVQQKRIRAHIKIQDGCDRYCTYCIIPYVRGPIRSRSMDGILADASAAGAAGCREVVLTGIRIASFGQGRGESLMDAVETAAAAEGVHRVRLGSLDPDELDEAFIKRAATCGKLCRHFHLSLQSGSDGVLQRMGRRYTSAQYAAIMDMIKAYMPDAAFTTDVMTGFVGETEQEFRQGMDFIASRGFARIHVFPYSLREGTAAARMKGHIPGDEKQRRARLLGALADDVEAAFAAAMVGKVLEIIPEPVQNGAMEGYARNYARVRIPPNQVLEGRVIEVKIYSSEGGTALGDVSKDI